jgi:hypothetical protein
LACDGLCGCLALRWRSVRGCRCCLLRAFSSPQAPRDRTSSTRVKPLAFVTFREQPGDWQRQAAYAGLRATKTYRIHPFPHRHAPLPVHARLPQIPQDPPGGGTVTGEEEGWSCASHVRSLRRWDCWS